MRLESARGLLLMLFFFELRGIDGTSTRNPRYELFNTLFDEERYNNALRPILDIHTPTNVTLDLSIQQLIQVDMKAGQMSALYWQRMSWYDQFLTWDPAEYDNVTYLRVPISNVWLPEIVVLNNVEKIEVDMEGIQPLQVFHTGLVVWKMPQTLITTCNILTIYFPYDTQTCTIAFGPWSSGNHEIAMKNERGSLDATPFILNGEWILLYSPCVVEVFEVDGTGYDLAIYLLQLERRPGFYETQLVYPTCLINMLASVTFLLPAESGEKIGLSITVFLALCVNMLIIGDLMPSTSLNTPVIAQYFLMSISMVAISLLVTVFVINMSQPHPNARPPPKKVMDFCVKYFAPLVLLSRLRKDLTEDYPDEEEDQEMGIEMEERPQKAAKKEHLTEAELDEDVLQQWTYLTRILDRFFAIVFFSVTLILTVFLLGRVQKVVPEIPTVV